MSQRVRAVIAGLYLFLCLLLGGASAAGILANASLQVIGLLILLALLWTRRDLVPRDARLLAWTVGLFVLWVVLTLVPIPLGLWRSLPYRSEFADALGAIGVDSGAFMTSLAPRFSLASLLSLLPPAALFLLVTTLRSDSRRWVATLLAAAAILSVVLGIFQLLGGPQSPLRFYEVTNDDSPVGFFANVNHQVTLILCAIPVAAALGARAMMRSDRSRRTGGAVIAAATLVFLLIGVGLAGSVAGYGLVLVAGFAALLIYRRAVAGRISTPWRIGLGLLLFACAAGAFLGPLGSESLGGKFSDNPTSRATIAATTLQAVERAFPLGTGLGSFASVYRRFQDPAQASNEYVNHAHNDYLEVLLELGVVGALLVLLFLLWWARRAFRLWRDDFSGAALARAGTVMVGLVLLHSLVDYPLRTAAIAAVFAFACALMVSPPAEKRAPAESEARGRRARHVSA